MKEKMKRISILKEKIIIIDIFCIWGPVREQGFHGGDDDLKS